MLDKKIKEFKNKLYDDSIPAETINFDKETFAFAIGYLFNLCISIKKNRKYSSMTHHMENVKSATDFIRKCYIETNDKMNYSCIWQRKLVAIVFEGSEIFKNEKFTTAEQVALTQGMHLELD